MIGSKGDLKQGILGVLTAGFMHPMKAGFNKLIAHGVTGGVRSRLSGGSFKSGFLGSAVSYGASWSGAYEAAGVSSQANTWAQRAQNVIASYVVGGVAAELGGGKFANGGMSAAFSRMFNRLFRNSNPRSAYNRASGKVDILGRNKQQQERERFLSRENQRKRYKFLSQSVRDPLSADRRQLHSTIENLDDLRLYKTLPSVQHKQYCDKDYYK